MSTAVQVGRETTHGTIATTFASVPCNFSAILKQGNKVLDEDRQGQDRNFAMQKGQTYEEFEVSDSGIYHDSIGWWLLSAIGLPTVSTVDTSAFSNVFKFVDDPRSLSLKWQQPRRSTQAYQSLYAVVDEMEFAFEAEGDLTYSCSGVAMGESEIAAITHTFTDSVPMPAWAGTVTLGGGAFADLVSGKVSIKRNRKPFFTINNTQQPGKMSIGARTVEFELVLDFVTKTQYDIYKAASTQALTINWEDADSLVGAATQNAEFTINLPKIAYEEGEVDTDPDLPLVKLTGKALYDSVAASIVVLTVISDVDYTA